MTAHVSAAAGADAIEWGRATMIAVEDSPADAEGRAPRFPAISVQAGRMVVLTGPPGSGKSAILGAAAGVSAMPGVRAILAGRQLGAMPHRKRRAEARSLRLFYLPHDPPLISNLTVLENLLLPIRYLGERKESEALKEAALLLDAAGLSEAASWLPARLTTEDRKTTALIRGFMRRPSVALLDDVFSGLAGRSLDAVRSLIRSALDSGACAILAAALDPDPYRELGADTVVLPDPAGPSAPETVGTR
jgi:putative ABC transport system ATP-binding protein